MKEIKTKISNDCNRLKLPKTVLMRIDGDLIKHLIVNIPTEKSYNKIARMNVNRNANHIVNTLTESFDIIVHRYEKDHSLFS